MALALNQIWIGVDGRKHKEREDVSFLHHVEEEWMKKIHFISDLIVRFDSVGELMCINKFSINLVVICSWFTKLKSKSPFE